MRFNSLLMSILFFLISGLAYQSCISEASAKTPREVLSPKNWKSFEEAVNHAKVDQKKILVDVYTDWCKWCKVMDEKTFSDSEVCTYLSQNFHLAKFNAEDKSSIKFKGQEYNWSANGRRGYNELATELLDGQLAYPSLVVFNSKLDKIEVIRGYKTPEQLLAILQKEG